MNSNRISILGSLIASLGFFFFPLLEIKPNRLASGITVNLFEIEGDLRYVALFILALAPLIIAFQDQRKRRGWFLVIIGNLLIYLTLLLPATAAELLLNGALDLFEEGTRVSNPRISTAAAVALGLLGGYVVLFGGIRDLVAEKVSTWQRAIASSIGVVFILAALLNGNFDVYSILVEFSQRGDTLGQRFIEHLVFIIVSLTAGLAIGIALGLWAARDARMEDIILYVVGIIQTIPSLALFGLLLVPLARLGDQTFMSAVWFFLVTLAIGSVAFFIVSRVQNQLPEQLQSSAIVFVFVLLFIPISLLVTLLITLGFESVLNVFLDTGLRQFLVLAIAGYSLSLVSLWLERQLDKTRLVPWLGYIRLGLLAISTLTLLVLVVLGGRQVIGSDALSELTIRDFGVSGIGTAPAIIALTLYSLLPLVRNTYAGLKNVDSAVIDSGRGMGMTDWQIFFQIELPLALPIIMAGVRSAGISLVGIAAVASIIGAGALGDFILLGVNTTSVDLILLGALPAILLAVILDTLLQVMESILTSPGISRS